MKNLILEFEDILINELSKKLLSNRLIDHKIDLVQKSQPLSKLLYLLN